MKIDFSSGFVQDLGRIRRFLASVDPELSRRVLRRLRSDVLLLATNPRIAEQVLHPGLEGFEVRRYFVMQYEIRYLVEPSRLVILRVWHQREDR